MIIHTYHFVSCINIILILIYNCYNEDVYLPMELYYLCIDFVFQFIVEKYRNKLNQIKIKLYTNSRRCCSYVESYLIIN